MYFPFASLVTIALRTVSRS